LKLTLYASSSSSNSNTTLFINPPLDFSRTIMETDAIAHHESGDFFPKIDLNNKNNDKCVVNYLENNLNLPKSDTSRYNGCIPDDVLINLKQTEQPKEYLGPLRRTSNVGQHILRRPDNVWNNIKMREKLKFLTDQTVCSCGAGK
jgi:hypothetical protein